MRKIISIFAFLMVACMGALAAPETPFYLPGEGVYIVGINPRTQRPPLLQPTFVAEAYHMSFLTWNCDVASAEAGGQSYSLGKYFNDDNSVLDIAAFMGIGTANKFVVRNLDGESYQLGQYSPNWPLQSTRLLAAYDSWKGIKNLPMGVYDHWDCPVVETEDPMLKSSDFLTVDFGNPYEGLVLTGVSFNLLSASDMDAICRSVTVTVKVYADDARSAELWHETLSLTDKRVTLLRDGVYSVVLPMSGQVVRSPFEVTISGLGAAGAWLPRAVDTHDLYPTHTRYADGKINPTADACLNVEGYFNYIGTWGLRDGKEERGEVVSDADYVQVYYDPSDPDWPGDYFMGEAAFPVECTFGGADIILFDSPTWIIDYQIDESQWKEYGAIQLSMVADALEEGETGRQGRVVFATKDLASFYYILVRQGAGKFEDIEEGIDQVVNIPAIGGIFDLMGRCISEPQRGQVYIVNGKKSIY